MPFFLFELQGSLLFASAVFTISDDQVIRT